MITFSRKLMLCASVTQHAAQARGVPGLGSTDTLPNTCNLKSFALGAGKILIILFCYGHHED